MAENRMGKYLAYAIGEIALVVIGILLALQINTWNDQRMSAEKERLLLKEMRENLLTDLQDCDDNLELNANSHAAGEAILAQLESGLPMQDSMRLHYANLLGSTVLTTNTSAFDNLKSIGFDLIRNDSLRRSITRLYSERYRYLARLETEDISVNLNHLVQVIASRVNIEEIWSSGHPIDLESLRTDEVFKGALRMNNLHRGFMTEVYKGISRQAHELIDQIDRELAK